MKKYIAIICAICLVAVGTAYAVEEILPGHANEDYVGTSEMPWGYGYFNNLTATSLTVTNLTASTTKQVSLPIMGFTHNGSAALTASTAPGLEVDDSISAIVFADGEVTPIQQTFRVPPNYSSGGSFRVFCTESNSTTPNQVDFDVYVNRDGVASDASATNQTPVALAGTLSTPDEITLTPATDFASLAAGDFVTLRLWRDDTADGSGDLEIKGAWFVYTATR